MTKRNRKSKAAPKKKAKKRSAFFDSYRDGWGIIGPYGNVWSPHIFQTKEEAVQHVTRFWAGTKIQPKFTGPESYKVVWMRQRAKPVQEPSPSVVERA